MQTLITELLDSKNSDEDIKIDENKLQEVILDLSNPEEARYKAFYMLYEKDIDLCIDVLNQLISMYSLSNASVIKYFMRSIGKKNVYSGFLRSMIGTALCDVEEDNDAYDILYNSFIDFDSDIGTPYKISVLYYLSRFENKEEVLKLYESITSDIKLNSEFRYKIIFDIKSQEKIKNKDYYVQNLLISYVNSDNNNIRFRILGCQQLLIDYKDFSIEKYLLEIAKNENYDENTRADSADTLMNYGSDKMKKEGFNIIAKLGNSDFAKTIYDNSQNVHTKEIDQSANDIIEYLHTFEVNKELTYVKVKSEILKLLEYYQDYSTERVNIALTRISLDRAIYSRCNASLTSILIHVWSFIVNHENKEQQDTMKIRLMDELDDMAMTCSTGFANRLANIISGITQFNLRISWADEISGQFAGRLNASIRDMDDLELQARIFIEFSEKVEIDKKRKHFLYHLRKVIPNIHREILLENKQHIPLADIDMYFRQAVMKYESGEKD